MSALGVAKNDKVNREHYRTKPIQEPIPDLVREYLKEGLMKKQSEKSKYPGPGQEIAASLREAIAWAKGEEVPVKVTRVQAPAIGRCPASRSRRGSLTLFVSPGFGRKTVLRDVTKIPI